MCHLVQVYNRKGVGLEKNYLGLHLSLSFISAPNTSTIMQIQALKYADHILSDSSYLFT